MKHLFALFLLLTTLLLAEESIPVGLEQPSAEEKERLFEIYQEEESLGLRNLAIAAPSFVEYTLYGIVTVGYQATSIILDDNSFWLVKHGDGVIVNKWLHFHNNPEHQFDHVYITSNEGWIYNNEYPFRLVHVVTGESAEVVLSQAPWPAKTRYITSIDYEKRLIEVIDYAGHYSIWEMTRWDHEIVAGWKSGQRILFGRNSRWNSDTNPLILINIDTYNYARGSHH